MKLLGVLRETPIGRALIAYFVDLPRWALLNALFGLALVPSLFAVVRGEIALALVLSFPPAAVLAGLVRLLSVTLNGRAPQWSQLWQEKLVYGVVLSAWGASVLSALLLFTPLLYVAVVPAVVILLLTPLAICGAARLNVSFVDAWRNALVMAVHYPVVALGLVLLGLLTAWGISASGGALVFALPALWAAIAVYSVDDLITTLQKQGNRS
jgi:hypothetical protein